jgi:hypothetical protein
VKRVLPDVLPVALHDPDPQVRREVARRIKSDVLPAMAIDSDPLVRRAVAERLDPMQLMAMSADEDLRALRGCRAWHRGGARAGLERSRSGSAALRPGRGAIRPPPRQRGRATMHPELEQGAETEVARFHVNP